LSDDRYDRLRRIAWWDQPRLARARVVVVGAGALGNELLKNLALLGVGRTVVIDLDRVENSNLARSVLYRPSDIGSMKAVVAARAMTLIDPSARSLGLVADVTSDVGLGVFAWADVILGGLDNRAARLFVNRAARLLDKTWIDGGIESIQGTARVFDPADDSPCYECTISDADWRALSRRQSCNPLSAEQMAAGHTPTTPTISSILAGVQVQEMVKHLHGLPTIHGRGWNFAGETCESFTIEYQRRPTCQAHERFDDLIDLGNTSSQTRVSDLIDVASNVLGSRSRVDFGREIVLDARCVCGRGFAPRKSVESLRKTRLCDCGGDVKVLRSTHEPTHELLSMTLPELGLPGFDILRIRQGPTLVGVRIAGDAPEILGKLWEEG
jgi:adenylyltransferase/sulfurtransferase